MNERAFRLDFFIAIAALVMSSIGTIALVYQTRVIGDQYAATIWPYLSVTSTYSFNGERIDLQNEGLGPALIQSAALSVDGKPVPAWNDYLRTLFTEPEIRVALAHAALTQGGTISTASIGPSSTIRPGDTKMLLTISYNAFIPPAVLQRHKIALDFCYCSLNGNCWMLHASPGSSSPAEPHRVSRCETSAGITSYAMSPSARPRRR